MTKIDPDLLNLSEIIKTMGDLTLCNNELVSTIGIITDILYKEDSNENQIFKATRNISSPLINIVNYAESINELKNNVFIEVENGNINQFIIGKLEKLNDKSSSLLREYVPIIQSFRRELKSTTEFTEAEKEKFDKNMGHELYYYLDTGNRILGIITKGLKNHITDDKAIEPIKLMSRINNLYLNQDTKILSITFEDREKEEVKLSNNEKELFGMILNDPYIKFNNFPTHELADKKGGDKTKAHKWIENTSRTLNIKMKDQAELDSFIIYNVDNIQINNTLITESFLRNP